MTAKDFLKAWPVLKRQVKSLNVPWLENFASFDRDPFKILISCILSLRTQDRTTGRASERLFDLASDPESMSRLSAKTIEKAIYPVGFYRVKAERIQRISREIVEKHHSKVPDTIEELLKLEGVGRKTANLVLNRAFSIPAIPVDTHVHRISNLLGLVRTNNPQETENQLKKVIPRKYWSKVNRLFVSIGRQYRSPKKLHKFLEENGLI